MIVGVLRLNHTVLFVLVRDRVSFGVYMLVVEPACGKCDPCAGQGD